MNRLTRCKECSGFMIATASHCPHCDARAPRGLARRLLTLGALVGTGGLSLTLMACYGSPCAREGACKEPPPDDMSAQVDMPTAPAPNPDGGVDGGTE
jgi:hypothetical protein